MSYNEGRYYFFNGQLIEKYNRPADLKSFWSYLNKKEAEERKNKELALWLSNLESEVHA